MRTPLTALPRRAAGTSTRALLLTLLFVIAGCVPASGQTPTGFDHPAPNPDITLPELADAPAPRVPVVRSEAEWRETLTDEEFRVLREHGTERPFRNAYHDHHEEGVYTCGGCGAPLFTSADKYDSGTGWPSYTRPAEDGRIGTTLDNSLGVQRVEVHCASCGGHLGHVFPDGPPPDRQRYCINSASLDFVPADLDGDGSPAAPSAAVEAAE